MAYDRFSLAIFAGLALSGAATWAGAQEPTPPAASQAEDASPSGDTDAASGQAATGEEGGASEEDAVNDEKLAEKLETEQADRAEKRQADQAQQEAADSVAGEIDEVLSSQGLMRRRGKAAVSAHDELVDLATRAGLLLRSTTYLPARYSLLQTQARVYSALAQDAILRGNELDFTRRLRQLRSTGTTLLSIDLPRARSTGAYWVLLADLADINQADAAVEARQQLAREVLQGYIEEFADDAAAADLLIDARLALARLYDQAGHQTAVAQQLTAMWPIREADPRMQELNALRASLGRIGNKAELSTRTTRGLSWRLEDNLSGPVLIHFYADGSLGSEAMIDGLMEKIARSSRGGYTVISFRVGPAGPKAKLPAWPTLIADSPEHEQELLSQFGVTSTPALIWIDTDQTIAAVGQTLAVFDRLVQNEFPPANPLPPRRRGPGADSPDSSSPEPEGDPAEPSGFDGAGLDD